MSDKINKSIEADVGTAEQSTTTSRRSPVAIILAIVAVVTIAAALATWLLWPKQAGKPVAAPRTVSFEQSSQPPTTGEQRLTLTPEQLRSVQLKIETVGEAPAT